MSISFDIFSSHRNNTFTFFNELANITYSFHDTLHINHFLLQIKRKHLNKTEKLYNSYNVIRKDFKVIKKKDFVLLFDINQI